MASFRLTGLDASPFIPLFTLSDAELARRNMVRVFADDDSGYPCRVSLEDAAIGDELLLLPFVHLPEASPYRSSGPIFIRRHAQQRILVPGEVPPYVTRRTISLRVYDTAHRMIDAHVLEGPEVAAGITHAFTHPRAAYMHLHNARHGCFSCQADRAQYAGSHQ
ncbi:DUF1203 domain-containing protein [Oleiagrimonas sp. MCCC 1A03011]|uniref:DUF1203 domain-containing protein n=1 Tax=Oleiagrimonas sp. MCCC 1A03011 TaxID=1926883 RepID=UPI000DC2A2DE|nr:DUF1203 domain-containing protein [Oleiagrimonas sp. MCCC 1A03011]RAP58300.1 hypothetical protein BTJ49_04900 [Oleiagrimonas sp. MCCC 1A03011]